MTEGTATAPRTAQEGPAPARYSAFISYNHRDEAVARWLHRAIETYRIPAHLQQRAGLDGRPLGRRLKPAFRDRDEVTPSADLAAVVRAALDDADALVVVCSPHGARSKWVNAEIRHFTALGRRDRILCLIVGGEPMAADPAQECLPPALFDGGASEPLAADIRPQRDTRDDARLKLLAALLGLQFDELRRREHARRVRRLTAIATGAMAGLVVTGGLAIAAYLARNEAVRQRDIARERSVTAERTVEFVKNMFTVSDPSEARGSTITAREILDRGKSTYAVALADEPVVKAEIGLTLSEVYGALGLYRQSDALVRDADEALPAGAVTVRARQSMLGAESRFRLGEYEAARAGFEQAIAAARADDNARETVLARALVGLGLTLSALAQDEAAERAANEAIALYTARGIPAQRNLAYALESLARIEFDAGRFERIRLVLERANAIRLRIEGENSPSISDNLGTLASVAYMEGRSADAEALFRSRLAIDETVLGPNHPDVATTLNNIGRILLERRAFAEAEPLLDRAVGIALPERGAEHDDMAFFLANLAIARNGLGRTQEAEALFGQARVAAEKHHHRMLGPILTDLAAIACGDARIDEGVALLDQAAPVLQQDYPDDAWRSAWLQTVRAECQWRRGDRAAAAALMREAAPAVRERWPADSLFGEQTARREALVGSG